MNALIWLKFLETFKKDEVYIEEFDTCEQAYKRSIAFKAFVTNFKRYINNPRYTLYFDILHHLELKLVRTKLYFIYHTDTILIHNGKFASHNARLHKLGYPRIQNV